MNFIKYLPCWVKHDWQNIGDLYTRGYKDYIYLQNRKCKKCGKLSNHIVSIGCSPAKKGETLLDRYSK